MNFPRIKQPKRSFSSLTGVVPVSNYSEDGIPQKELIRFESKLERNFILRTDFCLDCAYVRRAEQFEWYEGTKRRRYTPDFELLIWDENRNPSGRIVVEVKYSQELEKKAVELEPKFEAAREYYRKKGWSFLIQNENEIEDTFLKNAIFLREFRSHPCLEFPLSETYGVERRILALLGDLGQATPNSLLACISDDPWERAAYLPYLWRLVSQDQIRTNLLEPLNMESKLWHVDSHKNEGILWRCFLD